MCKLLLLDNDEIMRMIYRDELEAWGYSVVDTDMTLNLLERIAQDPPDAMIMDANLGKHDGLDLLQSIRNRHYDLPVILCTDFPDVKHDPRALAADYVVVKGRDLGELTRRIRMALDATQSLQETVLDTKGKSNLPAERNAVALPALII